VTEDDPYWEELHDGNNELIENVDRNRVEFSEEMMDR
jgi:hypothetical protein